MNYFIFFVAVKGSTVVMAGGKEMQDPLEITVMKVLFWHSWTLCGGGGWDLFG